jgi:hypothetical protein
MATTHPSFHQPDDTSISVWRYTDLSKFIWMLQKRAFYFARADLLDDPYEGYHTRVMADPSIYLADVRASYASRGQGVRQRCGGYFLRVV